MKKVILTIVTIATLFSCTTEDRAEIVVEPTPPTNNTGNTGINPPRPTEPIVGDWELFKTETYYDWGVDTDIINCKPTLEIFSNLQAISKNCIGGGVREFSLIKQGDRYIYDWQEDTYVYIDGEYLKGEYAGDSPRVVDIYRRR